MTISTRIPPSSRIVAGAGGFSLFLLVAALGFQFIGNLQPCALCVLQRWPHLGAVVAAAWCIARWNHADKKIAIAGGALCAFAATILAGLHTGVELGLWASPVSCGIPDLSDPAVRAALSTTTPPDCATPAWTFLGHSMAAWNLLFSSLLLGVWAGQLGKVLGAKA